MFGNVLLQPRFDGAAAFGRRGVATDPDNQATGLAPAAPQGEQDFRVRRLAFCRSRRDDLRQKMLLRGNISGDSPHFRQ
jgi:hypothetical protein